MTIVLGQDNLEVALQKDKHSPVVGSLQLGHLMRMDIEEAIVAEDLHELRPSPGCQFRDCLGYAWEVGQSLHRPKSAENVMGERGVGVRVQGLKTASGPHRETGCIKPPSLASIVKLNIRQRMMTVLGFAGKDILLIGEPGATQGSRTREGQSTPKKPPSHESLDANKRGGRVKRYPQHGRARAGVTGADDKAFHSRGPALVDRLGSSNGSTPTHCSSDASA
jgi:hypothetical protein